MFHQWCHFSSDINQLPVFLDARKKRDIEGRVKRGVNFNMFLRRNITEPFIAFASVVDSGSYNCTAISGGFVNRINDDIVLSPPGTVLTTRTIEVRVQGNYSMYSLSTQLIKKQNLSGQLHETTKAFFLCY